MSVDFPMERCERLLGCHTPEHVVSLQIALAKGSISHAPGFLHHLELP